MSQDNIPEKFRQRIKEAKEKQLEELDLSNDYGVGKCQKLTRIPDEVFELIHLKKLYGYQLKPGQLIYKEF